MEGVPERDGLVTTRSRSRDFQCDFNSIRTAGREQNFSEISWRDIDELFRQRQGWLASEATWCKRQGVHLPRDGSL